MLLLGVSHNFATRARWLEDRERMIPENGLGRLGQDSVGWAWGTLVVAWPTVSPCIFCLQESVVLKNAKVCVCYDGQSKEEMSKGE